MVAECIVKPSHQYNYRLSAASFMYTIIQVQDTGARITFTLFAVFLSFTHTFFVSMWLRSENESHNFLSDDHDSRVI